MASAYYERDGIELHLGDCREVSIPKCDLLVTDPPYGQSFVSSARRSMGSFGEIAGDEDSGWVAPAIDDIVRTSLRRRRHAYVFGPPELLPARLAAKVQLVWDKSEMGGKGDLSLPWSKTHEPITFAVHISSQKEREHGLGGLTARLRQQSVIRARRVNGTALRHPTEKPVSLLRQLIESSSCMGEVVLDPFAGSGSTLVAAIIEGRLAIGVEIDERWAEVAARRIDAALDAMSVIKEAI